MPDPDRSPSKLAPRAMSILRRIAVPALVYEAGWKVATLFLLGPITTALLNAAIAAGWDSAVTNVDLIDFGGSPLGIATIAGFGVLSVAIAYFELAGLIILAMSASRGRPASAREVVRVALRDLHRLIGIAALEIGIAGVCLAPFAAMAWLTYALMLSGTDINFYLATRPPRFLAASAIVGSLAVGAAGVLGWLLTRWVFAVPVCLFEGHSPGSALRASAAMVRGRGWRAFWAVVGWQLAKSAGFAGLALGLDFAGGAAIDAIGRANVSIVLGGVAFLMVVIGGAFALASIADVVGFGVLVTVLYEETRLDRGGPATSIPRAGRRRRSTRRRRLAVVAVGLAVVSLLTAGEAVLVVRRFAERRPLTITAHRAGPRPAPENSLAALRAGIDAGADFAEIDVQKTADGVLVIVHDEDLRRLGGVARTVRSMNYDEIKMVDIGSRVGPAFAGERVATLDAFIAEAGTRIGLNIELKYYGKDHDPTLARDVVALLRERGFRSRAVISSLSMAGLADVRRLDPSIAVGAIVSATLGDLTRLDLDFLSLRAGLVTTALIRKARRRGLKVAAWTVDDRVAAISLIDRGVDDLITDDPATVRRALDWHHGLSDAELVLLRFRDWLGSSTFRRVARETGR